MASAAAALLAFAKAIPALWNIYQLSVELYIKEQNAADERNVNRTKEQRNSLLKALGQPGLSDEDRNNLRRLLHSLHGR
jgi:hypothetical protein